MADNVRFLPLTPDRVDDFLALFGPRGALSGCWCTYFLFRPKQRQAMTDGQRRDAMLETIRSGPPPGMLAYRDNLPIGWMRIGPRAAVPEWNNTGRSSTPLPDAPAEDPSVWAISCFFVTTRQRGTGLSHAFVSAGIDHARSCGARLIEASPMDHAKTSKSVGLFVGSTSVFAKAGFVEVARGKPGRPLMRLML